MRAGILVLLLFVRAAQSSGGGPLTSFADSLRAHGIGLSQPALIDALRNSDPEIRAVAALKLDEDHDSASVAPIEDALATETDPRTRIAMAEALWGLHDPTGLASLQAMCTDESLSIFDIVEVAQHLGLIGESSAACASPILTYLDPTTDRRQVVLPALPDLYRWVPSRQAAQIISNLQDMLTDEDGTVRMEASHALAQIGSRGSIEALSKAIAQENDPSVQASLENDLDRLENKPGEAPSATHH